MNRQILTIILILFPLLASAQPDSLFPSIDRTNLPDARFRDSEIYNTETLHMYKNIDPVLLREYGCIDAWICEIRLMKGKYLAEVFRMYGPEEAFGIFSATRENLTCNPAFSPWACNSQKSLHIARGRYFICITSDKASPADSAAMAGIANAITCKIAEPSSGLSDYLPAMTPEALCEGAFLVKGPAGLEKTGGGSTNYLKNSRFETAVIYRTTKSTLISIRFSDPDGIMNFASGHNWRTKSSSQNGNLLESGENVKILSENQLLVEIPE